MTRLSYPLDWGSRTFVMGILNVTPDSFSGDGLLRPQAGPAQVDSGQSPVEVTFSHADVAAAALEQARRFTAAGVDILDIGAESTRPGSVPISEVEELERLIPVIESISRELDVLVSVDTYKTGVARAALQAGADWINDVWALRADPGMAHLAASSGVPIILMHNRSKPAEASLEARLGGRYVGSHYDDLIPDICTELGESIDVALKAGVQPGNIIVDPGIGFGKTLEQNLEIIRRLGEFKALGCPVLAGPSRKGFIGYTLNLPPGERLEGTAAAVAICIDRGADIVRVHDVEAMIRVARMTDAIVRTTKT